MTAQDQEKDLLVEQAKQTLDQQVDELDAATLSRLRHARIQALDALEAKQSKSRLKPSAIWGGGLTAAAALVLVLVLVSPGSDELPMEFSQEIADVDILADDNSIEFYEDLDFYLWLEQQELETDEV